MFSIMHSRLFIVKALLGAFNMEKALVGPSPGIVKTSQRLVATLLIFCTKCEGKFVPVAPLSKMLLSMCSVLAWAGGRADS